MIRSSWVARRSARPNQDLEELFRSMAKRGRQANLSFFAFTATPKNKTLAVFGRDREPVHRYTMRQAIEEKFILDVLKHYTTYATYYKLANSSPEDPEVDAGRASAALARCVPPRIITGSRPKVRTTCASVFSSPAWQQPHTSTNPAAVSSAWRSCIRKRPTTYASPCAPTTRS